MRTPSKRRPLALVASALLAACDGMGHRDEHTLAKTTSEGPIEGRPTLGMPIAIPGHVTCLIPFSLETRKWAFQDRDPFTSGLYGSYSGLTGITGYLPPPLAPGGTVRWHNAIVSDPERGEQWAILSQRGVIERWHVLGRTPPSGEPFRSEAIVFVATIVDSNLDGLLDDRDASVAIVTEGDGRNPRTVTPRGAQVWDFSYDEAHFRLSLLVVADTDGDGRYTTADAPVPYLLDIRSRDEAARAVNDEVRRRAEALLK